MSSLQAAPSAKHQTSVETLLFSLPPVSRLLSLNEKSRPKEAMRDESAQPKLSMLDQV